MKHLKDLFEAEFKNLYAMEKQLMNDLDSFPEVAHQKLNKVLLRINSSNTKNYAKIQELNANMGLNPGSTTDSVAHELIQNLKDIESQKLNAEIKQAGLLASFNRLATYRTTNYYNAYRMARVSKLKQEAKALKKMMKRSKKQADKLMKFSKKKIFKKAKA